MATGMLLGGIAMGRSLVPGLAAACCGFARSSSTVATLAQVTREGAFAGAAALTQRHQQHGFSSPGLASQEGSQLHFCVVGSGPSGMFTVDRLLKKYGDGVKVTVVDRLPTPFGLVRSGVAPDHQDTKNVINQFMALGHDPRVTFLGNVNVGRDVSLDELRRAFNAVVLCYGAESDRKLNIPGENGPGVYSAREFVWWYNGHPDMRDLPIDLSKIESVAIAGIGNVALDCTRVLIGPHSRLAKTDAAAHALAQLGPGFSKVREVHLVARRGPVQAACTPKELKELLTECGLATHCKPEQLAVSEADKKEMAATRMRRRVYELFTKAVEDTAKAAITQPSGRSLHLQFYRSPSEVLREGPGGSVSGLKAEVTELRTPPGGGPAVAQGTGRYETIPCQLLLKSIGYKSLPLEGAPYDPSRGVIPNKAGRVLTAPGADTLDRGLYVCGWLKRGPTGIIGTNMVDADETVDSILKDTDTLRGLPAARATPGDAGTGAGALRALLGSRGVRAVSFSDWLKLDAAEVAAGYPLGKVREKETRVEGMLKICHA